jgi:hypothetical protein
MVCSRARSASERGPGGAPFLGSALDRALGQQGSAELERLGHAAVLLERLLEGLKRCRLLAPGRLQ